MSGFILNPFAPFKATSGHLDLELPRFENSRNVEGLNTIRRLCFQPRKDLLSELYRLRTNLEGFHGFELIKERIKRREGDPAGTNP